MTEFLRADIAIRLPAAMTHPTHRLLILFLGLSVLGFSATGHAQAVGRSVVLTEAQNQDLYAAGGEVDVQADVTGDLVVAGRNVVVAGAVTEDLIAAGRTITVSGAVADDVRLAGRQLTLSGTVAGHAAMAGREVRLQAGSRIGDWARIAARRVYIAGTIDGDLKVRGRRVELNGQVNGDVELAGSRLRVGDKAVINGKLTWRGRRAPTISDQAVITGEIVEGEALREFRRPRRSFGSRLLCALSVVVTAGLLYTLLRANYQAYGSLVETRPGASLATGLAVFAATPVIIVLLFASGIGTVIGLLLALAYLLLLMLGGLSGVILMARLANLRFRSEPKPELGVMWLSIALVALVMALLYVWRPLGSIVAFIIMLLGLGALSLDTWRRARA